jgi:hypothetical protein
MLTALESNTAPECLCGILLREDRDDCPVHGTKAQEMQAPRKVSVGRTQPLWDEPSVSDALDEIWQVVERMYFDGRITWRQRGLFQWAARKSREVESPARCSRYAQSTDGAPIEEL